MVEIINSSIDIFFEDIKGKKIYLFGAGRTVRHCIDIYCKEKEVVNIIDNNCQMIGKSIKYEGKEIKIINVEGFVKKVNNQGIENVILLITPVFYAWQIIEQLDKISELDHLRCYLHFLLRNYPSNFQSFQFTQNRQKIPAKIHYFWFGKKKMPQHLLEYINTWREKCKDYEIICWNEKNYDISKNQYMKEAYDCQAWGFVPDYARLDVIYKYGGIYLDTDVEVLKNLDVLLNDDAFFGAGGNDQINLGSGFGAVANHPLIGSLRDYYIGKSFFNSDGSRNCLPCYNYQHPVLREYGFEIKSEYQKVNDVVLYPAEVLSPTGIGGLGKFFSPNTISVHHTELSWISDREKAALETMKKELKKRIGEI